MLEIKLKPICVKPIYEICEDDKCLTVGAFNQKINACKYLQIVGEPTKEPAQEARPGGE